MKNERQFFLQSGLHEECSSAPKDTLKAVIATTFPQATREKIESGRNGIGVLQ